MANTVYTAFGDIIYNYLRTNDAASELWGLLVNGADGIIKSGSLMPSLLKAAEETRRRATPTNPTLLLMCSVQRGKEVPRGAERYEQLAHVRFYDRGQGDELIKPAGDVAIKILHRLRGHHTEGQGTGLLNSEYAGRSGIIWDPTYQVLYEVITFVSTIVRREG